MLAPAPLPGKRPCMGHTAQADSSHTYFMQRGSALPFFQADNVDSTSVAALLPSALVNKGWHIPSPLLLEQLYTYACLSALHFYKHWF